MRDLHTLETARRKQSVSAFLESQAAVDEKEIEEITSDLSLNSLTNNIPSLSVINLQARNGQLLQHTQASMEVLTPIQSSTVEIKKKENMSAINLAEFESYSTNPFEEMELKTLNDKEELAMLLQPSPQPSYGLQYQNYNPSTIPSWTENVHIILYYFSYFSFYFSLKKIKYNFYFRDINLCVNMKLQQIGFPTKVHSLVLTSYLMGTSLYL
jgi:hypothetical protein